MFILLFKLKRITEKRKEEERRGEGREEEFSIHWFTPKMTAMARAWQVETSSSELHLGFFQVSPVGGRDTRLGLSSTALELVSV